MINQKNEVSETDLFHPNILSAVQSIVKCLDEGSLKKIIEDSSCRDFNHFIEILCKEANDILQSEDQSAKPNDIFLDKLVEWSEYKKRCLSFTYFVSSVLHDFKINWHHLEWFNFVERYDRLCILASRSHGKSFAMSLAYPLWRMYRYNRLNEGKGEKGNGRICLIITNEFSLSISILTSIKRVIETNEILRDVLYPSKPGEKKRWAKKGITCKNGSELDIGSLQSQLRGKHPDYIIVDDLLGKGMLLSAEQRNYATTLLDSDIIPMVQPNGQIVVIGTILHEQDLYSKLKKMKSEWKVFEYPAIMKRKDSNGNFTFRALWQERFSLDNLVKIMSSEMEGTMNYSIFMREWMLVPFSSSLSIFPFKILKPSITNNDDITMIFSLRESKIDIKRISLGCDLSISVNNDSADVDYTVFTLIGETKHGDFLLLYQWRERGESFETQIRKVREICTDFTVDIVLVENNGYQDAFIQRLEEDKDIYINIERHTTSRSNKTNRYTGLPALSGLFERKRIRFPRGDSYSRKVSDSIISELQSITFIDGKIGSSKGHDDQCISLWLAIKGLHVINKHNTYDFI